MNLLSQCMYAYVGLFTFTYRLLKREESFEKKLIRPGWGDSPGTPPVAEYSKAVLFRGLV